MKEQEKKIKSLIGKWSPVDATGAEVTEREKQEILKGGYLEFTSGGLFVFQGTSESPGKTGLYNYNENTNALDLQSGDDEKHYKVDWLGNDKIILVIPDEDLKITFQKNTTSDLSNEKNKDAYKNGQEDGNIIGTWNPVYLEGEDISEEEKQDILNGATIEFTPGGNYIATSTKNAELGKYTEIGTTLRLETEARTKNFTIEWLGKNKFIMSDSDGRVKLERKN
jgi:hypothetical protein